jgi:hypothetical protein
MNVFVHGSGNLMMIGQDATVDEIEIGRTV